MKPISDKLDAILGLYVGRQEVPDTDYDVALESEPLQVKENKRLERIFWETQIALQVAIYSPGGLYFPHRDAIGGDDVRMYNISKIKLNHNEID